MHRCPRTVNTVGCKRTMCWQLLCVTQCGSSLAFKGRKRISPEKEESHKGCGFSCVPALKIRESFQKKRCCDQCPGRGTLCVICSCACWVMLSACSSHLGPNFACWSRVKQDGGAGWRERWGNAFLSNHKHFSVFSLWIRAALLLSPSQELLASLNVSAL